MCKGSNRARLLSVDLFADVVLGAGSSNPVLLADAGGKVYFTANDGTHGNELFVSDGNTYSLLKDINPTGDTTFLVLYNANGTLFMNANDGVHGGELWKTDGTPGGTVMVDDINPGSGSGNPGAFASFNGEFYFQATDGVHGRELWVTDGTNTHMVQDIRAGAGDSSPSNLTVFNNRLFFTANDGTTGVELYSTDGSDNGATMVKDIWSGNNTFGPSNLTLLNGNLYFQMAENATDGFELWKSDGSPGGTGMVKNIAVTGSSTPTNFCVYNGFLYFAAGANNGADVELWRTDGTDAGTTEVKDINPGTSNSSSPQSLVVMNNTLYFLADDGVHGQELWRSDGSSGSTTLVKDIRQFSFASNIKWLTPFNNELYFQADDGSNGAELYRSDGTSAGTVLVRNINTTAGGSAASSPVSLRGVNGSLYFFANDGVHGNELWKLTPPSATATDFNVNTSAVTVTFNETGSVNLTASTYSIQNTNGGATFSPTGVSYNAAAHTASFSLPANLPDGRYRLTIPSTAATDAYGNWMAASYTANFFTLTGDADHSGTVDTTDFMTLAQNFAKSAATFSQGDFNLDGTVNALDFNLLATQFGAQLPAPSVPAVALSAVIDPRANPTLSLFSNQSISMDLLDSMGPKLQISVI